MSVLKLKLTSARALGTLESLFETAGGANEIANRLVNFLTEYPAGRHSAPATGSPPSIAISIQDNEVQASDTITFSGANTANDTVIVNGVTFTCVASNPTGNEWLPGSTATASAANLAAAINASVTALVSGYVSASSLLGVMTVTSAFYGPAGNMTTLAKGVDAGPVMVVAHARLISGASDATAQTLNF